MGRKTDPNSVIDDFEGTLDEILDVRMVTCDALAERPLRYRQAASRDAFFRMAVAFEVFRSDWHIACINRDPERFRQEYRRRLRQSIEDGKHRGLLPFVRIAIPAHPNLTQINNILDPDSANIRFGAAWKDRAATELEDPYRGRVLELATADINLVEAVRAIRNCLAHASQRSIDGMNAELLALDPDVDEELRRDAGSRRVTPASLARYLHADTSADLRRVELYVRRLRAVAVSLRVP